MVAEAVPGGGRGGAGRWQRRCRAAAEAVPGGGRSGPAAVPSAPLRRGPTVSRGRAGRLRQQPS